jgi:large subunit ribosomal protein L32
MALPKSKISKARGRSRRANWKIQIPSIVVCPHCKKMKLAHRVCKFCGYYAGKEAIHIEEKAKKAE